MKHESTGAAPTPESADLLRRARERLASPVANAAAQARARGNAQLEGDARRLLNELQVHQVELELQNEQLEAARAWIEAALSSYTELYDFAPVAYLTLNRLGTIAETNLAGARLLGQEPALLIDQRLGAFIADADRARLAACLKSVFTSGYDAQCEVALPARDGAARTVEIYTTLSANGEHCRAVLVDVSKRVLREQRAARLADVFTHAPEGMLITDSAGVIVDVNHAFTRISGYARDELLGQHTGFLRSDGQGDKHGDKHGAAREQAIAHALAAHGHWRGPIWQQRRDGHAVRMMEQRSIMPGHGEAPDQVLRFSAIDDAEPFP